MVKDHVRNSIQFAYILKACSLKKYESNDCKHVFLRKPDVLYTQQNKLCLNILHILAMASVFLRVGVIFLTKIFDSENQNFRTYPSNTCQYNIWDIIRCCRWTRFHKKEIKNIAFLWSIIILSITFEHNLYNLPYSLRYIKYTPYTCNTKIFSSVYLVHGCYIKT